MGLEPAAESEKMKTLWGLLLLAGAMALSHGQSVTNGNFRAEKSSGSAAVTKPAAPAGEAKGKEKIKTYPFHGELESVGPDGTWIRLKWKSKSRELVVTGETKVTGGSLGEAKAGERITGSVFRNGDGREQARTINLKR
jgi:hypothetical protein